MTGPCYGDRPVLPDGPCVFVDLQCSCGRMDLGIIPPIVAVERGDA